MNLIIPMAGIGKRLRPHTLITPKPLILISGKTIVERLIEDIAKKYSKKIENIAFIINPNFGTKIEQNLSEIALKIGIKSTIYYQKEPLGTAHAILCAKELLQGKVIIVFADTLFDSNFKIDENKDCILWIKKIENPKEFGVVKLNSNQEIIDFIEKPQVFISDLAMIGIYYFKNGENLKEELQYLLDCNIQKGNEYQLPDAFKNMIQKGVKFFPLEVNKWMDCGNKNTLLETNTEILLQLQKTKKLSIPKSTNIIDSIIIEPCFIDENVVIKRSIIGPNVSIHKNSEITNSNIKSTIIYSNTIIQNHIINDSIIGNHSKILTKPKKYSLGDYSTEL